MALRRIRLRRDTIADFTSENPLLKLGEATINTDDGRIKICLVEEANWLDLEYAIIQVRTAAQWASLNPVLPLGTFGYASDTRVLKIGDGTTAWNDLLPIAGGGVDEATVIAYAIALGG